MKFSSIWSMSPVYPQTTGICSFSSAGQSVPSCLMGSSVSDFTVFCKQLHLFRVLLPEQVENYCSKIQIIGKNSCRVPAVSQALVTGPHSRSPHNSPGRVTVQLAFCRWGALRLGEVQATQRSPPHLPAVEQLHPLRPWRLPPAHLQEFPP